MKWDSNTIPVCWSSNTITAQEWQWVRQRIEATWESNSLVDFVGWGNCVNNNQRAIKIIEIDGNPRVDDFGKLLAEPNKFMRLNFDFRTWGTGCRASQAQRQSCIEAIAVHEFGHALGFLHEQDRSDNPDSLCADQTGTPSGLAIFLTRYDPDSVMNYCNPLWNNGGQLSARDIEGLQKWYGRRPEDQYLVGDWDGDGRDNIAVRRGNRILMDFNYDGVHDREQSYGGG